MIHQADPVFLQLKRIATAGGEHGPEYDQGVLSVVAQIESSGSFAPTRLAGILDLRDRPDVAEVIYSPQERADLELAYLSRGWTVEQGYQYVQGVVSAESLLSHYKRPDPS